MRKLRSASPSIISQQEISIIFETTAISRKFLRNDPIIDIYAHKENPGTH